MTRKTKTLLLGATVTAAVIASVACKGKKHDETTASSSTEPTAAAPAEAPAETINPEWKTKCPQADRPAGGTVTALVSLTVHEQPDDNAAHKGGISAGTWVNLLGIKQNWYCIDYPCAEGKLCPGWVMDRNVQRSAPRPPDAGILKDAAVPVIEAGVVAVDAAKPLVPEAGAPPTATTTATPPGTGRAPPVPRPPAIKLPK